MSLPSQVKIVEVGPRDGLQNESEIVSVAQRVQFIQNLAATGLGVIETGSFISPKWVPQMADTAKVFKQLDMSAPVQYPVLVPNLRGLQDALAVGVKEIAVFAAASETFSQRNINCGIAQSLVRYQAVIQTARANNISVRGYVSCALGCPYEGDIGLKEVSNVAQQLFELGCYEISLGDTIGVGTPKAAQAMLQAVSKNIPFENLAVHFHDTYGQALANIYAALELGVSVVDSSVAGLGGCPYAKGASGNVATEDVVYMLDNMNIKTGVDLGELVSVGRDICRELKTPMQSKVNLAWSNHI